MSQPLFIFTQAPNNCAEAREGIEALLACAAFDLQPDVLFINKGVLQLVPVGDSPGVKNLYKMIQAFELYGVQSLFVCTDSIARFGVDPTTLNSQVTLISLEQRIPIIQTASWVVRF